MSLLTEQSEKLKKLADELLALSKLLQILEKYGQIKSDSTFDQSG
mgnify:FL=1